MGLSESDRSALEQVLDCAAEVVGACAVVVGNDRGTTLAVPGVPGPREVTYLVSVIRVLSLPQEPL